MRKLMEDKLVKKFGLVVYGSGGGCEHLSTYEESMPDTTPMFLLNKDSEEDWLSDDTGGEWITSLDVSYCEDRQAKRVLNFLEREGFHRPDDADYVYLHGSFEVLAEKVRNAQDEISNNEFFK